MSLPSLDQTLRARSAANDFGKPRPIADPLEAITGGATRRETRATRTLLVSVLPTILRTVIAVLGGDHPEVEDVAQESALALVAALGSFRRECGIQHFAACIAIRTAAKACRRLEMRDDALKTLIHGRGPPYPDIFPRQIADGVLRRQVLRSLFHRLPVAQSEAFVMHFVLELKVKEIAAAAGVPANTVRSRLRLAKVALRSRVESDPALRDLLDVQP